MVEISNNNALFSGQSSKSSKISDAALNIAREIETSQIMTWLGINEDCIKQIKRVRTDDDDVYIKISTAPLRPHEQWNTAGRVDTVYVVQSAPTQKTTVIKKYEECDLHFGLYAGAVNTRESFAPIASIFGNYRSVMASAYGVHHLWSVKYDHEHWGYEAVRCGDQGSGVIVGWTPRKTQRDLFIVTGWHWEQSDVLSEASYRGESIKGNPVNGIEGLQLGLTYVTKNLMVTGAATWGADRDMNSDDDTTVSYRIAVQFGHSVGF